jgi:hypothetical protein
MKSLIVLLVMSTTATTCATAGDADGTDHRLRCSQLIMRNPALKKDIYFWLTVSLIARCLVVS